MSDVSKGFSTGSGVFLAMVVGLVLLFVGINLAGRVVAPCPSCHGSGSCVLCGGTGKGMLFGDCMNCGGKKSCPNCGGVGYKAK
jgi:hypothetical protein